MPMETIPAETEWMLFEKSSRCARGSAQRHAPCYTDATLTRAVAPQRPRLEWRASAAEGESSFLGVGGRTARTHRTATLAEGEGDRKTASDSEREGTEGAETDGCTMNSHIHCAEASRGDRTGQRGGERRHSRAHGRGGGEHRRGRRSEGRRGGGGHSAMRE